MNKAKKYKLKLDYTEEELKELKEISINCSSSINAIVEIVDSVSGDGLLRNLGKKCIAIGNEDKFDFVEDINNVVRGTAIFPENKYFVHDSTTNQYLYYNIKQKGLHWGQPHSGKVVTKTKDEWLAISPAYEPMLERVEDDE